MAVKRRPVQARRVRRFEMERPSVVAVLNEGAAWTATNAQRVPGLALALTALAMLVYLFASPQFYVYKADVTGTQRLSADQVYQTSAVDMSSVFFLAPRAIEVRLLEALPGLEDVRVALGLPARLHIAVVEKQASIVWEAGEQSLLADEQGVIIGAGSAGPEALHIRAIEGAPPATGQALDRAVLETALGLSDLLGGARSFEYSPRQGIGWRTEQGWPVYFGVGGDPNQLVAAMRAVMADIKRQGLRPQFLDVSVPGRPFYR